MGLGHNPRDIMADIERGLTYKHTHAWDDRQQHLKRAEKRYLSLGLNLSEGYENGKETLGLNTHKHNGAEKF